MSTKSCGRLDIHEPHEWTVPPPPLVRDAQHWTCPGHVTTEGGQHCATCQVPVAGCGCRAQRAADEYEEWFSE